MGREDRVAPLKRRVIGGINFHDHYSCDLDCGHVIIVQGTKRPSVNQECRYCREAAAKKP